MRILSSSLDSVRKLTKRVAHKKEIRYKKVSVSILQYGQDTKQPITEERCCSTDTLATALNDLKTDHSLQLHLIVVEDLSRDVIELLGSRFDVDPSFFRQHVADYAWYNIGSWWRDPPNLDVSSSGENWFSIRFLRMRRFANKKAQEAGKAQSFEFNVYRRLDNDHNESPHWHGDIGQEVTIGHVRSKASLWIEPHTEPNEPYTGIDIPSIQGIRALGSVNTHRFSNLTPGSHNKRRGSPMVYIPQLGNPTFHEDMVDSSFIFNLDPRTQSFILFRGFYLLGSKSGGTDLQTAQRQFPYHIAFGHSSVCPGPPHLRRMAYSHRLHSNTPEPN